MTAPNDLAEQLREIDAERYLASLYLPEEIRRAVQILYLFDCEIARIPNLVSEPMPGEIRLQWWRDILQSERAGEALANPLASALLHTIEEFDLPREGFEAYLDARVFDLYNDPMPNKGTYEGYLGETASFWFLNACLCAGITRSKELSDAAGHAGVAFGMARNLAQVSRWSAQGQVFAPAELLKEYELQVSDWLYVKPDERHRKVVIALCDETNKHLNMAKNAVSALPKKTGIMFLPLVFTQSLIIKIRKSNLRVFSEPLQLGPLKRQYLALRAGIKGNLK